ncbi:MAG: bifunctional riboflavin kinase/FAD synthetase [Tissierellia bacterium]|nr:bifunctional riboflavin kinase/FAD synthetase [Tissierellia bacterium]
MIIDLNTDYSRKKTAICLGNFDGMHRGHQQLMNRVIEKAKEKSMASSILLFTQHTQNTLKNADLPILTDLKDKINASKAMDICFILEFDDEIRQKKGEEFISYLKKKTNFVDLFVGEDYRFGKNASSRVDDLKKLQIPFDFKLHTMEEYKVGGIPVRSTNIRRALDGGNILFANLLLGRDYAMKGKVVHGRGRGRSLGFPTANLETNYYIPSTGVYRTLCIVEGKQYRAMTSIGTNKTFLEKELKIESYLMDFHGDLYGKEIKIIFKEYLRQNVKFKSKEALIQQLNKDLQSWK